MILYNVYVSGTELDFAKNCVFIDETGFNLHTQRNHDRSYKGKPTKSIVPTGKGVNFAILSTISQARIINVGVRKSESASSKKKKKKKKKKAHGKEIKVVVKVVKRNEN